MDQREELPPFLVSKAAFLKNYDGVASTTRPTQHDAPHSNEKNRHQINMHNWALFWEITATWTRNEAVATPTQLTQREVHHRDGKSKSHQYAKLPLFPINNANPTATHQLLQQHSQHNAKYIHPLDGKSESGRPAELPLFPINNAKPAATQQKYNTARFGWRIRTWSTSDLPLFPINNTNSNCDAPVATTTLSIQRGTPHLNREPDNNQHVELPLSYTNSTVTHQFPQQPQPQPQQPSPRSAKHLT